MRAKTATRGAVKRGNDELFCYGRWERIIGSDRRIILPSKFRQGFGKEAVIVEKNDSKSFLIYPIDKIQEFDDFSKVWIVVIDRQGKIMLPPVISFSQSEVLWLGKGDHFEVQVS